jgi:hypothetical protein
MDPLGDQQVAAGPMLDGGETAAQLGDLAVGHAGGAAADAAAPVDRLVLDRRREQALDQRTGVTIDIGVDAVGAEPGAAAGGRQAPRQPVQRGERGLAGRAASPVRDPGGTRMQAGSL